MIHIGLIDISSRDTQSMAAAFEKICSSLPLCVSEKIRLTKNEKEKKLRTGAYLLLYSMYKEIYREVSEVPNIKFSDEGKPFFEKSGALPCPDFNISHSGELAAVVIGDGVNLVGIDIQEEPKVRARLERAAERFFAPFKKNDTGADFTKKDGCEKETEGFSEHIIAFYGIDSDGNVSKEGKETNFSLNIISESEAKSDTLARWTVLEASLKMSGGGFADYSNAKKIIPSAKTLTAILKDGKRRYSFTVAICPENKHV